MEEDSWISVGNSISKLLIFSIIFRNRNELPFYVVQYVRQTIQHLCDEENRKDREVTKTTNKKSASRWKSPYIGGSQWYLSGLCRTTHITGKMFTETGVFYCSLKISSNLQEITFNKSLKIPWKWQIVDMEAKSSQQHVTVDCHAFAVTKKKSARKLSSQELAKNLKLTKRDPLFYQKEVHPWNCSWKKQVQAVLGSQCTQ